ncbi:YihY/virulence factor BrkB family protein [Carnobacterium inhibens]|uniref:YihY family inner membrane protein n=1 Tax=Carnobacterium inhibens TaxID=147709 RepID=A0ABR7TEK0_9LACT|nr:YihY/virulence factor BrkB family protein [Carnobacterium inhibens]MBC9825895.1 YihY family inner membrane protein [Carnobacterium inhibens]
MFDIKAIRKEKLEELPKKKIKIKGILINFFKILVKKYREAEVWNSGAIIAYYFLLSVFPIIVIIGNILPYLHLDMYEIVPYIENAVPQYFFDQLESTVIQVFTRTNNGILSLAVVGAFWSASRGMTAMQISMNKAYGVKPRRNVVIIRLFSIIVTTLMILSLIAMVIVFGFGQLILEYITPAFELPLRISELFQNLRWPVTMSVLFAVFCLLYYFVPHAKLSFRHVLPGAIFSTVGWMLVSQVFAIYVEYFAFGTKSYGAIGTFMILLIWLQVIGALLTVGAVINAAIEVYQNGELEESNPKRVRQYIKRIRSKNSN